MTNLIIDTILEYPELMQGNGVRMQGILTFEGAVKIEVKTNTQTITIFRTIAQTMTFLDACDAVEGLIVSSSFGKFTVL